MRKYKLLQDYPPYVKDDIVELNSGETHYICTNYPSELRSTLLREVVENFNNWFAPHIFIIEDDVDIYMKEYFYTIYYLNKTISKVKCTTYAKGDVGKWINFSTKEAAEEYLKKKEIHEWVICKKEYTEDPNYGKLNLLYQPTKITGNKNQFYNFKELKYHCNINRFEEATKAEVAAHLKWFHIGDKVWHKKKNIYFGIISGFRLTNNANLAFAINDTNEMDYLESYTNKKPQPKPLHTFDYSGTGYCRDDNKLILVSVGVPKTCETCEDDDIDYNKAPCITCFRSRAATHPEDNWRPKKLEFEEGSRLMLGDDEMKLEYHETALGAKLLLYRNNSILESIYSEDWLKYYSFMQRSKLSGLHSFTFTFNNWIIIYEGDNNIKLGCIHNVTWDQIEKITKTINEL